MSSGKKTTSSEPQIVLAPRPVRRVGWLHRRIDDRTVRLALALVGVAFLIVSSVVLWRETYGAAGDPALGVKGDPQRAAPWVLLGGVSVAWLSIVANIWLQRRQSRAQLTLDWLRTTKLDREYLQYAARFRSVIPVGAGPLDEAAANRLLTPQTSADRDLREAASFLLNFYELAAAALYREDLESDLMARTIRGTLVRLVIQCSPYIAARRRNNPRAFEHLIWLATEFVRDGDLPGGAQVLLGPATPTVRIDQPPRRARRPAQAS